ncbi:thioredoxin reductase (NADPH) [Salirhabdus euzebyi]|uniref:Thioredoxin reductase (NADPH) n=1 Tax=Salirhabdus euzebyi TaxID=394506 RepID=A0A841Q1L5_9BACI|nr:YpdA family putative bacillithiol disulfide reductase [Salirhabdus euzebyi]MBB6452183.1 thioredoxin reductase (NADPH) [Salirhabdus euzebyi]
MNKEEVIIVGAGPCGMSVALELQARGIDPLLIEKGNVVNSIYHYPTHQTFFSSSDKLEIGNFPFITEKQKPVRNEALTYYRTVAERKSLRIHSFEKVNHVRKSGDSFQVFTQERNGLDKEYVASFVVIATGYYDQPNMLNVPGEHLNKVQHYFKEAHPFYNQDVVVIGGKNSAVDATIELEKAGAKVTVLYRGDDYSSSIKPWILPLFESLVRKGKVNIVFNAQVTKITDENVFYSVHGEQHVIENDYVFAMTGYHPDHSFLKDMDIEIEDETGRPTFDENTMETNIPNIYVAGVIAAGFNNNEIFIENGRFHGELIAKSIMEKNTINRS